MNITDLVKMGLRNLLRRKARTALTILGVVIGTISIVIMVSIGIGVNESFDKQFMENGEMTIIRIQQYGSVYDDDGNWAGNKEQALTDELVYKLKKIKHVKAVAPVKEVQGNFTCGRYTNTYVQIVAIGNDAFGEFGFPGLEYGNYPTDEHPSTFVIPKMVLSDFSIYTQRNGYKTKEVDPLHEKVMFQFRDWSYTQNDRKKPFSMQIKDFCVMEESDNWAYNGYCYLSMNYFKEIYSKYASTLKFEDRKKALAAMNSYSYIKINVDNINNVTDVQDEIKKMGYETYSDMQYLEPLKETANMLELVLGAIGGVAMLVSAINIANTMVMSIYERTKEIGVMKVLGCLVSDIKKLFLIESAMLGLIGGIIGIGFSCIASALINRFGGSLMSSLLGIYDTETKLSVIPFWLPILAAGFGMFVGILAGYFPARRATRISAIEAMKNDA